MVDIAEKPQLEGVEIRWVVEFWDRILSGMADWEGRDYWLEITDRGWIDSDEDGPPPKLRYWLIPLSDSELRDEWSKHRLFERYVVRTGAAEATDAQTCGNRAS